MDEPDLDYQMKSSGISFVIEGSINELVCLVNEAKELFLWNPTVRKYKKLPDFETKSSNDGHFIYGFGYDEIHDDYKVVRIFSIKGRLHDFQEVNMYSLMNNSWRKVHCYRNGTRLIGSGKFVNGKLYSATTASLGMKRGWSITSFDLVDEKWRIVERPCHGEGDDVLVLGVLGRSRSAPVHQLSTRNEGGSLKLKE
ncbi:hypothetical protein HAX54_024356 [Datura stramonium]|uniref:F-box associated beta-propeller type 3 domain-containing protein n=1 Tax=Datura stramonium TaxID=4076 RepID=A0ABS8S7L8_DATST|nr:hypothetical protein [Datura stramonium]